MNHWGKVIGFLLGYLILRLPGAILGLIIGALFDRGLKLHLYHIPRGHTKEVEDAFFKATFSVMGHLAKADGRVSEQEIRAAEAMMERLELDKAYRKEAIRLFTFGKSATFDLSQTLNELYRVCRHYPDLLRFFVEIQLNAALVDGHLQPEEHKILLKLCEALHLSPMEFEALMAREWASQAFYHGFQQGFQGGFQSDHWQRQHYTRYAGQQRQYAPRAPTGPTLQDAYGVLGVSPEAKPLDIKKAYRKLMNQHHPDKLAARGLPESMIKHAKEKTQQIRTAYDLIREARGFK